MSQIRTANDVQDWLDKDFAWRAKEILSIKSSLRIDAGAGKLSKTMLRAGIALLYAHWEGFIKVASEAYLEYVSNQNLRYSELKPCFIVFGLKKELSIIVDSNRHSKNARVVEFLVRELTKTADLSHHGAVNTQANLSSSIFEAIATSLGINVTPYTTKFNLIDKSLLRRRNQIAHGEYLDIGAGEFDDLSNEVIDLMHRYKTDIENCVAMHSYKV